MDHPNIVRGCRALVPTTGTDHRTPQQTTHPHTPQQTSEPRRSQQSSTKVLRQCTKQVLTSTRSELQKFVAEYLNSNFSVEAINW